MRFRDKVVVITGGASNIGRAASLAFAREGARVVIADFDVFAARDAVALVQDVTEEVIWVRVDLKWEDQIIRMRDVAVRTFGGIDILINNAAQGTSDAPLEALTTDDWEQALSGNVRHMFLCAKHVIPALAKRGGGAIVNTGSIQAIIAGTPSLLYGPSKAGIVNLTRHLAMYYGHQKIRANCVCPGHVVTPRTRSVYERAEGLVFKYPIGRLGRMEDVVAAYLYLASDEAAFVTGAVLMVDGGFTVH